MKMLLAILCVITIGCAGSGPNGAWTPADSEAAVRGVNSAIDAYGRIRDMNQPYYPPGAPFPIYPTSP